MKFSIKFESIEMRLAEVSDAAFILDLRAEAANKGFINQSVGSVEAQEDWLRGYKLREKRSEEFYFVSELKSVPVGVTRIYNITDDSFTPGSWVFKSDLPNLVAIKSGILSRLFAFEKLQKNICYFDVRKSNSKVLRYHQLYRPECIGESDLDFFFKLDYRQYRAGLANVCRLLSFAEPDHISNYIY